MRGARAILVSEPRTSSNNTRKRKRKPEQKKLAHASGVKLLLRGVLGSYETFGQRITLCRERTRQERRCAQVTCETLCTQRAIFSSLPNHVFFQNSAYLFVDSLIQFYDTQIRYYSMRKKGECVGSVGSWITLEGGKGKGPD